MNDDLEIIHLSDKTGDARSEEIWKWLSSRIEEQAILQKVIDLINRCHTEMEEQGRGDWTGGFSLAKRYRCTLVNGEYVPMVYVFTYLRRPPLKKNATEEQAGAALDQSVVYTCYFRPDETDTMLVVIIESAKAN